MKTLLVATLAATLAALPAQAGIYADAALLATIERVNVVVIDQVTDGCLANANGIQARLSATLEHSDIAVSEAAPWMLRVYFNGYAPQSQGRSLGCVLSFGFMLQRPGAANTWILAGEDDGLSSGPAALDSAALRNAEAFVAKLIAAILAARRSVGLAGVAGRRS